MSNERSPRGLCSTTIGISGMVGYPFDNWMVVNHNSNQSVVKEAGDASGHDELTTSGRRRARGASGGGPPEVDVEASPEEVFEALVTEEGRERWLEEPDRQIHVESADAPHRLVWWWVVRGPAGHARRVPDRRAAARRRRRPDPRDRHRERAALPARRRSAAAFEPVLA